MIKPFGKNIWIKPVERKQILVSDTPTFTDYGVVEAVGDSVKKIKKGDKIAYLYWGSNSIEIDDEKFWIIPETDEYILAICD